MDSIVNNWHIIVFLLACSSADAMRDGWLKEGWWKRHIAKWLAFYPPLVFIAVDYLTPIAILLWFLILTSQKRCYIIRIL